MNKKERANLEIELKKLTAWLETLNKNG